MVSSSSTLPDPSNQLMLNLGQSPIASLIWVATEPTQQPQLLEAMSCASQTQHSPISSPEARNCRTVFDELKSRRLASTDCTHGREYYLLVRWGWSSNGSTLSITGVSKSSSLLNCNSAESANPDIQSSNCSN